MFETCIFRGNSMNNLFTYCWLTDARMRAFEKDLPVHNLFDFKKSLPNILTFSYSYRGESSGKYYRCGHVVGDFESDAKTRYYF